MTDSVNAKNYAVDGTLVSCLLCRPEENKMPLSVLRDVHLPNVHFRSTKGKIDDILNNYEKNLISTLVVLNLAASNLPADDVGTMITEIIRKDNFNDISDNFEENFQMTFHTCKLCKFMSNTNSTMIEHCSYAHIDDENEKKDDEKIKKVFLQCFPDATYSIQTPFTLNDFHEEEKC